MSDPSDFGEPHVELGAEVRQLRLVFGELQLVARFAERDQAVGFGKFEDAGVFGEDLLRERNHILALVAVFGWLLAGCAGCERGAELVHLVAAVVDIELVVYLETAGTQHATERVSDGGPAGVPEVEWSGGVSGNELEVDFRADRFAVAVGVCRCEHDARDLALGSGGEANVQEPRPGDVGSADGRIAGEGFGEDLGELARVHAGLLAELQRDIRGVVAVVPVFGPFHVNGGWHAVG